MSNEAAINAPPVAVGTVILWGVPLETWVLILTLIYTLILIGKQIRLGIKWIRRKRNV